MVWTFLLWPHLSDGTAIVIDPFDDSVGYPLCKARADAALCSHGHFDHNYVQSLQGGPQVITDSAPRTVGGVKIHGLPCFHDDAQGAKRGNNSPLSSKVTACALPTWATSATCPRRGCTRRCAGWTSCSSPIGGTYTITTPEAVALIREARPHTAIAMHFKTVLCNLPITDEQEFVRMTGAKYLPGEVGITPQTLDTLPGAAVMLCPSSL